jgi:four helix bundle protein
VAAARKYTDLEVWQLGNEIREKTGRLTASERFRRYQWLQSQLDQAANSVCANIAEGFGRFKPKVFANSLRISRGSLLELKDHLENAQDLNIIPEKDCLEITHLVKRTVAALTRLIVYLESAREPRSSDR